MKTVVGYWMKRFKERDTSNHGIWTGSVLPEHKIVYDGPNVAKKAQRINDTQREDFVNRKVNEYLKKGIAIREPSNNPSAFNSPVVCAPKPQPASEQFRFAVNYSSINKYINPPKHPIPLIDRIVMRCNGSWFSKIDVKDGYYNIRLSEDSWKYTAFQTEEGRFWLTCLQPGLVGGAEAFQERIEKLLNVYPSLLHNSAESYQDDILYWSKTEREHILNVWNILERLYAARINPNWRKCEFLKPELEWCGRLVSRNGIKPMTKKAKAILNLAIPKNYKELKSMYHMFLWHAQFIDHFNVISAPLVYVLRESKKTPFQQVWTESCIKAIEQLKDAISCATELYRDGPGELHIYADASPSGVGGQLIRVKGTGKYLMGYYSHVFNVQEEKYSQPQKELLAMYLCCKHWKYVAGGRKLIIHCDAKSWEGLNLRNPTGMLARWLLEILDLCPTVVSIPGVENVVADALSRLKSEATALLTKEVPENSRYSIFCDVHNNGHFGYSNTLTEISKRFKWKGMDQDVRKWYDQCQTCQFYKVKQNTIQNSPMIPITSDWERVGMDVVSFTMESGVKKEFLLLVCYFSKEIRAISLNHSTAEEIIESFREEIELKERCPRFIISDEGPQFTSDVFKDYCLRRGITATTSTAYRHQGNGQVERMVQSFKEILRIKLSVEKLKWSNALASTVAAMNNYLPNKSTGFTPHEITKGYSYESHIANILEKQALAAKNIKLAKDKQKSDSRVERIHSNSITSGHISQNDRISSH